MPDTARSGAKRTQGEALVALRPAFNYSGGLVVLRLSPATEDVLDAGYVGKDLRAFRL